MCCALCFGGWPPVSPQLQLQGRHPQDLSSAAGFHSCLILWATQKKICKNTHTHTYSHTHSHLTAPLSSQLSLSPSFLSVRHMRQIQAWCMIVLQFMSENPRRQCLSPAALIPMHTQYGTIQSVQPFLPEHAHTFLSRKPANTLKTHCCRDKKTKQKKLPTQTNQMWQYQ